MTSVASYSGPKIGTIFFNTKLIDFLSFLMFIENRLFFPVIFDKIIGTNNTKFHIATIIRSRIK